MKKGIIQPHRETLQNLKREFFFFDKIEFIQSDFEWFIDLNITDESYYETLNGIVADIEYLESINIINVSDEYIDLELKESEISRKADQIRKDFFKIEGEKLIDQLEKIQYKMTNKIAKNHEFLKKVKTNTFNPRENYDLNLLFKLAESVSTDNINADWELHFDSFTNANVRFNSNVYNDILKDNVYFPIIAKSHQALNLNRTKKGNIIDVFMNKIPTPNVSTPWDKIIEFKAKHENILYKLRLDNWLNELTNSNASINDIEQKIEYYLKEYENLLNLEKIKFNYGTIGFFILETIKLLEDIVKFNWSKRLESILVYRKNNVDLLISETKATGKEIAYLSAINNAIRLKKL